MTRGKLLAALCVAALAGGATPAWAQRGSAERADPDSRSSPATGTGTAVDRGSAPSGSPAPSSSSGSSGSSSSPGSYSSPSPSSPSGSSSGNDYVMVPVRPNNAEQGRPRGGGGGGPRSGGGDGGARAVPRDSGRAAGSTSSTEGRVSSGSGSSSDPSRNAVPTYSRPRDGRGTGTAVDRPAGYYSGGGGNTVVYYPNYY